MSNYITIDSGTTNTRISLVLDYAVVDTLKFHVGARQSIENKTVLKDTIRKGIIEILSKNTIGPKAVKRVLASGMITSEFGLIDLPHIPIPAGLQQLHNAMYETILAEITPIPFVFMRGVKTDGKSLENTDVMRGEETELMGILSGEGLYILPGSHSKIIKTDRFDRIVDFKTTLTGEMISALSQNTILKDAVEMEEFETDKDRLLSGAEYARKHGINEALFKVRLLKTLFGATPAEIYNFYLGVVLSDEISYVLSQNPKAITIGGQKAMKESMAELLKALSKAEIIVIPDETADASSAIGAIRIFEYHE